MANGVTKALSISIIIYVIGFAITKEYTSLGAALGIALMIIGIKWNDWI